jgi:hypothetical protein
LSIWGLGEPAVELKNGIFLGPARRAPDPRLFRAGD